MGSLITPILQKRVLTQTVTPKLQPVTTELHSSTAGGWDWGGGGEQAVEDQRTDSCSATALAVCPGTSTFTFLGLFPSLQIEGTDLDTLQPQVI